MRLLAAALALAVATTYASAADQNLPAFTAVQVCTPFNVKIAPSTDGTSYGLSVEGDASVAPAVGARVQNGVLILESTGGFTTQQPVKVTARLPASKLAGVTVSSAAGITVLVDTGFAVGSLLGNLQGGAALVFTGLKADSVKLTNSGTGNLIFAGAVNTATVQASGTGATYVSGATGQVIVNGDGTSDVLINSATDSLKINGEVSGISSLRYNRGVCNVDSFGLGKACSRTTSVRPPATRALWSCGLQLTGTFGCQTGGGSSTSSSSSGGGNSFGSSSSSGGGSSSSFSSSSSSGLDNGFSFSSSSNGDGSSSSNSDEGTSTLTTNTGKLVTSSCAVDAKARSMAQLRRA